MKIGVKYSTLQKGNLFGKGYMFGGRVHVVGYTVIECHKRDGYILAMDCMGDVYRFYPSDFIDYTDND